MYGEYDYSICQISAAVHGSKRALTDIVSDCCEVTASTVNIQDKDIGVTRFIKLTMSNVISDPTIPGNTLLSRQFICTLMVGVRRVKELSPKAFNSFSYQTGHLERLDYEIISEILNATSEGRPARVENIRADRFSLAVVAFVIDKVLHALNPNDEVLADAAFTSFVHNAGLDYDQTQALLGKKVMVDIRSNAYDDLVRPDIGQ